MRLIKLQRYLPYIIYILVGGREHEIRVCDDRNVEHDIADISWIVWSSNPTAWCWKTSNISIYLNRP